ncbi:substrate-binding domain-containing protein [Priestia megaterium]
MLPQLQDSDLIVHSLLDEPLVLVGSADCCVLNTLDKSYENQRISECLIVNEQECSYRTIFEEYLRERGIVPSHTMELWSIEAMKRCIMSGLGIACLPLMTVNDEIKEGKLKIIPCVGGFKPIFSQVAYRKNKWISPALSMFIEITLKHARGLVM